MVDDVWEIDAEAVHSLGWRFPVSGEDHVVELGQNIPGLGHPRTLYLDDRAVVRFPFLMGTGPRREFPFDVGGLPASLGAYLRMAGTVGEWIGELTVDGEPLGPPGAIVGRSNRPAVGSVVSRRRRLQIEALSFALTGFVLGFLLPLASELEEGPLFQALAAFMLIAGVIVVPPVLFQAVRGRPLTSVGRMVLAGFLPCDLGIAAGFGLSSMLGVGTNREATDAFQSVAGSAVASLFVLFGVAVVIGVGRGRFPRLASVGAVVFAFGIAGMGVSMVIPLAGLFGSTLHDGGDVVTGMFFGSVVLLLVGGTLFGVARRGGLMPPPYTGDIDAPDG